MRSFAIRSFFAFCVSIYPVGLLAESDPTLYPATNDSAIPPAETTESTSGIRVVVEESRVANLEPAGSFAAPVTALRYDPLIDIQARNSAESQSDLVIRGGTFETSGVRIGSVPLLDPQTGHYLTEIPFDPRMLTSPQRLTGVDNSMVGFNNGSGSAAWGFRQLTEPIVSARLGGGSDRTFVAEGYGAAIYGNGDVGCDLGMAHSQSNGSIEGGDSDFQRISGRCQILGDQSQTDIISGYQEKRFSWPYLYALKELHDLVGSSGVESESLHTNTTLINHRQEYSEDSFWELGAAFRRNRDNYEFDRNKPGLFNPFEHTTDASSASLNGEHWAERAGIRYSAQSIYEEVDSTALTYNDYLNRTRWRLVAVPQYEILQMPSRSMVAGLGLAYEDSNRSGGRLSPQAEIRYLNMPSLDAMEEVFASITQQSQLPGFTALASNPKSGLFRGNQQLDQTLSTTYEVGSSIGRGAVQGDLGLFYRTDKDLVDWTYTEGGQPFSARTANNLDVDVFGTELLASYEADKWSVLGGHFFTHKDSAYDAQVDASFYALNFPKHRLTGALVINPTEVFDLRFDIEWREQEPNSLRSSADRTYSIGSLAANFKLSTTHDLVASIVVDNLWKEQFEEVPGVPGFGRSVGVFLNGSL